MSQLASFFQQKRSREMNQFNFHYFHCLLILDGSLSDFLVDFITLLNIFMMKNIPSDKPK